MMVGLPVVGFATTEMATAVENGVSGYVDTDVSRLVGAMRGLIDDPGEAARLGEGARRYSLERFGIDRFARDWEDVFSRVTGRPCAGRALAAPGLALAQGGTS